MRILANVVVLILFALATTKVDSPTSYIDVTPTPETSPTPTPEPTPIPTPLSTSDNDSDGYSPATGDCDDTNITVYPGATEFCDEKDNDCNGKVDYGAYTEAIGIGGWYISGTSYYGNFVEMDTSIELNKIEVYVWGSNNDAITVSFAIWRQESDGNYYPYGTEVKTNFTYTDRNFYGTATSVYLQQGKRYFIGFSQTADYFYYESTTTQLEVSFGRVLGSATASTSTSVLSDSMKAGLYYLKALNYETLLV